MLEEIIRNIERELDFTEFQYLAKTAESIEEEKGHILYIPTNKPIPFNKKVLNNILINNKNVLSLPIATNMKELRKNIYRAIEYIVEKKGKKSVVFFCISSIIDSYHTVPGSGFIEFKEVKIQDRTKTLINIFENLTNTSAKSYNFSNLSDYIFRIYLSLTVGEDTPSRYVDIISNNDNNYIYIPYKKLKIVPEKLKNFYLGTIGISENQLFYEYDENVKKNLFAISFKNKYGFLKLKYQKEFLERLENTDEDMQKIFRTLAIEKAIQGRLFDLTLNDVVIRPLDRQYVESIQKSYRKLFQHNKKINLQDPTESIKKILQHFCLLFSDIPESELDQYLSKARNQFTQDKIHISDYNMEQVIKTTSRLDNFLKLLTQISIIKSFSLINRLMEKEKWKDIFIVFLKQKDGIEKSEFLDNKNFIALNEARIVVEQEKKMTEKARRIKDMEPSLSTLPLFLEKWCSFILDDSKIEKSSILRSVFVNKYDDYTSEMVKNYNEGKFKKEYLHLTDLLKPTEEDKLRVFIIIDGFGYTDYQIIRQKGLLKTTPSKIDIMFSNIPSYTPSAVASILTGLTPEESGIYHWKNKLKEKIFNLKKFYLKNEDFEFIDMKTDYHYELAQRPIYNNSGLTIFAKKICKNVRLNNNFNISKKSGKVLELVRGNIVHVVDKWLDERERILYDPEKPTEAKEALESDLVIYVEDFDKYLHTELSIEEFDNYYISLSKFINYITDSILSLAEENKEESLEVIIGADHGKLTRREKKIIEEEMKYEFDPSVLKNNVELEEVYIVNFDEATFTEREGKMEICMASESREKLASKIRNLLKEKVEIPDEDILEIIDKKPFILSSQKFLFGWYKDSRKFNKQTLKEIPGLDIYTPKISKIFNEPDIGILSRYDSKHTPNYAHGCHGGTSISEMVTLRMIFRDDLNE